MSSRKPEYLGEPTLAQVMRRPLWILALLLAMVVAAVFAWLGQWQMDNAIRLNIDDLTDTETVRPLDELSDPTPGIPEIAAGAVVSADGSFVAGDYAIVSDRLNSGTDDPENDADRTSGAWVVGHFVRAGAPAASLSVAVGWAPDATAAQAAIDRLDELPEDTFTVEGRYLPPEAPENPARDDDPHVMRTMLPAYLANLWNSTPEGPIYGGYLVLHDSDAQSSALMAEAGLRAIDSVAPGDPQRVSWLNVFYAVEWIVFAGIALFLWYRLARDAWEKEHEMMLLVEAAEAEASAAAQ
ncbi:MAG: SURF1 family cytochrome oxidase biogenesis protein [Leucobacter sp.]